jgi:thioredoxin-like negative regulator of GroEL
MKAGRFASAEQSFRDAITLDPAPGRTMLNLALAEIALGRKEAAQSTLAQARGAVADADYGLALALAGDTKGAVAVLEGAAPDRA